MLKDCGRKKTTKIKLEKEFKCSHCKKVNRDVTHDDYFEDDGQIIYICRDCGEEHIPKKRK